MKPIRTDSFEGFSLTHNLTEGMQRRVKLQLLHGATPLFVWFFGEGPCCGFGGLATHLNLMGCIIWQREQDMFVQAEAWVLGQAVDELRFHSLSAVGLYLGIITYKGHVSARFKHQFQHIHITEAVLVNYSMLPPFAYYHKSMIDELRNAACHSITRMLLQSYHLHQN